MPWTARDAKRKTKKATGAKGAQWAKVANKVLERTGDDARAIKIANAVIKRKRKRK